MGNMGKVIMPHISFFGLFIVTAVTFLIPLLLGLTPARRLPTLVLTLVVGIAIGPSGLGWVNIDLPIQILSLLGLAFLLFLAGLEIDPERLKGRLLLIVSVGFLLSFGLAWLVGYGLYGIGQVKSPLFIAIILVATSFSGLIPLLIDTGEISTDLGQITIAGAMIAQFGSILLLSLFFSGQSTNINTKLVLFASFVLLAVVFTFILLRLQRSMRIVMILLRLQDTTAQLRVRGAFMLLVAFVALADGFGLQVIFGAFMAGVLLRLIDRNITTHEHFRLKLEAIGFGVFIPIFFVASGLSFDLRALFADPSTFLRVPLFLGALLFVRGLPAFLYQPLLGGRRTVVAGLLQSTSFSFIIVASQVGVQLGLITKVNEAALIAAGLLSVLVFPLIALMLLRRDEVTVRISNQD